jgi:hypothetical protein
MVSGIDRIEDVVATETADDALLRPTISSSPSKIAFFQMPLRCRSRLGDDDVHGHVASLRVM